MPVIMQSKMKYLLFNILLVFSASVYAKTYYCTQLTNIAIYFANEVREESIKKLQTTNDILKVELDLKNDKVLTKELGNSKTNDTIPHTIVTKVDEDLILIIRASSDFDMELQSLVFTRYKKEISLVKNKLTEFTSHNIKYKCSTD